MDKNLGNYTEEYLHNRMLYINMNNDITIRNSKDKSCKHNIKREEIH